MTVSGESDSAGNLATYVLEAHGNAAGSGLGWTLVERSLRDVLEKAVDLLGGLELDDTPHAEGLRITIRKTQ